MEPNSPRLIGAAETGLPDADLDRLISDCSLTLDKKNAAPNGPRSGGSEVLQEAIAKPLHEECLKAPRPTSATTITCISEEAYLSCWDGGMMIDRDNISYGTPEAYREFIYDALVGILDHAKIGMISATIGNDAELNCAVRCLLSYARPLVSTLEELQAMKEKSHA